MTKLKPLLFIGLSSLLLVACGPAEGRDNTGSTVEVSDTASIAETTEDTTEDTAGEAAADTTEDVVEDEMYVSKGQLIEPGEWTYVDEADPTLGKATLKKIGKMEGIQILDTLSIDIDAVKLLEHTEVSEEEMEMLQLEERIADGDSYTTLQVDYTVNNTGDQPVSFNSFDYITTDQGQQIEFIMDDVAYSQTTEFMPNTNVENYNIFFINKEGAEDISTLTFTTSSVWDDETYEEITTPESFELTLEE